MMMVMVILVVPVVVRIWILQTILACYDLLTDNSFMLELVTVKRNNLLYF